MIRTAWNIIGPHTEYNLWHSLAYCNKRLRKNKSKCDRLHFAEPFSGGVDLSGFGVDPVCQLALAWEVSQQRHQLFIVSRLDLPHLLLFLHLESKAEMNYLFSSWTKLSLCKPLTGITGISTDHKTAIFEYIDHYTDITVLYILYTAITA